MNTIPYRHTYASRIFYFLIISLVCLVIAGIVMGVVMGDGGAESTRRLRIATVIQDMLAFILPAVVTAVMVTSLPASMLGLDRGFKPSTLLIAVCVMIASIPAMNIIIDWNANLSLPAGLSTVEAYLKKAEAAAAHSVEIMLAGSGIGSTIISILIVGVLAGLSEELYFRGALQRLIGSGRLGPHATIWITAVIFSLFHMQFYGFVPRVLLGAWFGYLFYWTGSIWLPVIIHALNNSIYVLTAHRTGLDVNSIGIGDYTLALGSVIVTAILISRLAHRR